MSFDSLLNTTCTIEVKTKTQDTTSGEMVDSWVNHATSVKCRLDQAKGGEIRKADDVFVKTTHMLFLEYRTDLDENNYRIVIGSRTYNILLVRDAGGEARHTELDLEIVTK